MPASLDPELFRLALEASSDATLIAESTVGANRLAIRYVNPAFEAMTGWSLDEIVGQSPRILQGEKTDAAVVERLIKALEDETEFAGEFVIYRKNGSHVTVEWRVAPIREADGTVRYWVATQRDITERIRLTDDLERRVKERTRELEGFLYTVSHDFRAPLRAIMSASMILNEDYGPQLDAGGQSELQRQSNAAKKLGVLMDDLLRLSRLGRQEMHLGEVDVTDLAEEVAEEVASRPWNQKPTILVGAGLKANADPSLLRLLLQNLFENSTKFAAEGRPPKIELGMADGLFFVRDNGIGFDPEKSERIFMPFERLHGEAEYPGTGVGLANVKRIIDRHSGRIWAEGRPGEGATFWFSLSESTL